MNTATQQKENEQSKSNRFKKWFKRMGLVGFLFFLIKGIVVWIVIPYLIARGFFK